MDAASAFKVEALLHRKCWRLKSKPFQTQRPVIILELSGRNNIGATLTEVLEKFYDRIKKAKGRFYITELGESSYASFRTQADSEVLRGMHILKKESLIGKSTQNAVLEAQAWLDNNAPQI